MDHSLASLVTRERDDYFGRFFHSHGDKLTWWRTQTTRAQRFRLARELESDAFQLESVY